MDVRDLRGKNALVTGSASGIGRATALAIAERGASLYLCDVDASGLEKVADEIRAKGVTVYTQRVDVANPTQMEAFANEVHERCEAIDLLVNNAGVGIGGGFLDTTLEDWNWIVGINLKGVVHGCHFFLPRMVAAGREGHVVNVSSAAGFTPSQALNAYCTTKYGVLGMTEALSTELKPHGIGATAICPGIIDTPIVQNTVLRGPNATEANRQQMVDMYRRRGYGPERVARNILRAVQRNRVVAPISPEAWGMYYVKRLAPGLIRWLDRRGMERALAQDSAAK